MGTHTVTREVHTGRPRDKKREMAGTFISSCPPGYVFGYVPDGTAGKWGTRMLSSGYGGEWEMESQAMTRHALLSRGSASARKRLLQTVAPMLHQHHSPQHLTKDTLVGGMTKPKISKLNLTGLSQGTANRAPSAQTKDAKIGHLHQIKDDASVQRAANLIVSPSLRHPSPLGHVIQE